jgi:lycopene beta-cyclase
MVGGGGFEFVLVGGGLQAGLVALGLLARQRDVRLALVEKGRALGGNHTWCCHTRDLPEAASEWLSPLIVRRWPGYDVVFPGARRTLRSPYAMVTSTRLASVVAETIARSRGSACRLGQRAVRVGEHEVELEDGTTLHAEVVVDARGPTIEPRSSGFQKFLGLELEMGRAHGLARPVVIDATVAQRDGFRFFYVLPFDERRVLVEDTCFSRSPDLDLVAARSAVLEYAARLGPVTRVLREETGVLPMPWASDAPAPNGSPLVAGYRGGWFHPATGYSLPVAARLACYLASRPPREVFGPDLRRLHRSHRAQARWAEHLNGLLFHFFAPDDMRNVFERFYELPDDVIARFYGLSSTWGDRARIVAGRPPRGFSLRAARASVGSA